MHEKLKAAYHVVSAHMNEIVGLFKPGVKITVIVRRPDKGDQDFLMSDDDLEEVIALVKRRQAGMSANV